MALLKHTAGGLAQRRRYALVRVEKIEPPDGSRGRWYRYVLDNGRCTITGLRCGSVKEVTDHATQYAEQVNTRSLNGYSVWSPRGRKPAA